MRNSAPIPTALQYAGVAGITQPCIDAVQRLIQFGDKITDVKVLTHAGSHGLVLELGDKQRIGVKAGFGSGYHGEGSRGFSYIVALLLELDAPMREYEVPKDLMTRLNDSALTADDLRFLERGRYVLPSRWHSYVYEREARRGELRTLWRDFPPVIPFAIVDPRIMDEARMFWQDPDKHLMTTFRRLEDSVRKRSGLKEGGANLFTQAFEPSKGPLWWPDVEQSEGAARARLLASVYGVYRNARAHSEKEAAETAREQLAEFMMVNELYRLESESERRVAPKPA